jgi:hypothetical protein
MTEKKQCLSPAHFLLLKVQNVINAANERVAQRKTVSKTKTLIVIAMTGFMSS